MTGIPESPAGEPRASQRVDLQGVDTLAAAWVAERDAVLRGLTHALSNRVGTLSAVAGMLAPGEPVAPPIAAALGDEAGKLETLLALYRLLPLDRALPPEPLHLPDLLPSVVELHAHHAELRDVPCVVEGDPDAPPVLAPHSALVQALLVLLAAGARAGGDGARLRWNGEPDGDRVVLAVDGAAPAAGTAGWLLGDAAAVRGGEDGAATIELPTLAAARRAR